MNKSLIVIFIGLCLNLTACNKTPSECDELWEKTAKLAKQNGISEDALKSKKQDFEDQISKMPKGEAAKNCKTQLAVFDLVN